MLQIKDVLKGQIILPRKTANKYNIYMEEKYPIWKFKLSDVCYQIATENNINSLATYMKQNSLKNLIFISDFEKPAWNSYIMPNLTEFDFIEKLSVHWTNIKDINEIHKCTSIRNLSLDNDDKTYIDFSKFPYIEHFVSWNRKGIENVWDIPTITDLTVAGLNRKQFPKNTNCLYTTKRLRILKTPLETLSFLEGNTSIKYLELSDFSKIKSLKEVGTLQQLEYLYIKANNVSDFSFLKDLSSLKALFIISKVAEFSFEYFENMPQLERIALSGNKDIQRFNLELKLTKNIV